MTDERGVARAALAMLHGLMATSAAQDIENADAFVVVTTEGEFNTLSINGPFSDPVAALAWAEKFEAEVNGGNAPDDEPYVVKVYPMFRPDSGR